MDFAQAVTAHQQWKMRLLLFLSGKSTERLDPSVIERADHCELGKWIQAEGKREFAGLKEFKGLQDAHARFHAAAAEAVRKTMAGDKEGAKRIVDGELHEQTVQTVMGLNRLRRMSMAGAAQ